MVDFAIEVSDIQATILRPRPSPYRGEYVLLRIDEAAQGRELVRRIIYIIHYSQVDDCPRSQICQCQFVFTIIHTVAQSIFWFLPALASRIDMTILGQEVVEESDDIGKSNNYLC
jgi:hypothetical protein